MIPETDYSQLNTSVNLFFVVLGLRVAPSASNILLVAMTIASIMALVGVAYLGRKAMKTVNNPYNYEPLVVN